MKVLWTLMVAVTLAMAVYFLNPRAFADDASTPRQNTPQTTKELMGKFLSHMDALKPYMVSEEKFSDPKNFNDIEFNLKWLASLSKKAGHDPQLKAPGYRVSRKVLEDHIAETERVFRVGNKGYARWMLNSTLSICMSCHTQIPTASRDLKDFESTATFTSSFDQAEFLFSTRAFDQAKAIYDKMILDYPQGNIKSDQVETALERVVTYYARIQRNPEAGAKMLEEYSKNTNLPPFLKEDMKSWLKTFKNWEKAPAIDPRFTTDTQIVEFAKKNLDPKVSGYVMNADNPRAAVYLKVSGILYEYLQLHPQSPATPDLLYWLAICDKGLNNNFFYSLGDIYLRQCVVEYSRSPTAKLCYAEYESETILSYSGSGGTHLPEDVRKDLDQLKSLLTNSSPSTGVKN